jgi:hypothetical protein
MAGEVLQLLRLFFQLQLDPCFKAKNCNVLISHLCLCKF